MLVAWPLSGLGAHALCVALSTSVLEGVASKTRPLIEHGKVSMPASLEDRERLVASRDLVVAAAAVVGRVTGRASSAVKRSVFSVDVVFPARRVRSRQHYDVARRALILCFDRRRDVLMANEALRVRG